MADTSKFKKSHQLAKELLDGPDLIVVIPTPTFDMPGSLVAFPARAEVVKIDGQSVVALLTDCDALPGADKPKDPPPDSKEVRHCHVCNQSVTPVQWAKCSRNNECPAFFKSLTATNLPDAAPQT